MPLYAQRPTEDLGELYTRHVAAMTDEGLHSKSAIAAELAWRDQQIEMHREYTVHPVGGTDLTPEQAAVALREAMEIIQSVGTTGVYDKTRAALAWMKKYFPSYA